MAIEWYWVVLLVFLAHRSGYNQRKREAAARVLAGLHEFNQPLFNRSDDDDDDDKESNK